MIDIPRPERFKTPPNEYGSTGHNAKEYGLYIQDEAEAVFQDKYGRVKGTKAWKAILSQGNAMWKAADEILGQRITMEDIVSVWMSKHPELSKDTYDEYRRMFGRGFYNGSYIVAWAWWILTLIADGQHFTHNFISTCIPTFKGVLEVAPKTTKVLLDAAGIDVDNFQLSKKIQAKRDEEAAEQARLAAEKAARDAAKAEAERLDKELEQNDPVSHYLKTLTKGEVLKGGAPEVMDSKDNKRIIDSIIKRSGLYDYLVMDIDTLKAVPKHKVYEAAKNAFYIAISMAHRITDPAKKQARGEEAKRLGFPKVASAFGVK